ncbi:MAG: hypothetical protein GX643_13540 [Acidimicrobiales bacterium]|nr:hypothetical protein [Acidimicrobiales bacterium]
MITLALPILLAIRSGAASTLGRAHSDQRGEGVISAAIAVLVMAFLGAAMWAAFDTMFTDTTQRTNDQVDTIGVESGQ